MDASPNIDSGMADGMGGVLRLGDALRSQPAGPGAGPLLLSVIVHAAAIALFFTQIHPKTDPVKYETIAIHLVSPPPTVKGPPEPIQTTSAVVATPKVETKKTPAPAKPKTQTQSTDSKVVSKPKDVKPAAGAHPKPGPVGGEGLNIQQEGIEFAYPEYSAHIIKTLIQYFRWDGAANLTAQVKFNIRRDGSVVGADIERSSGNVRFDLAAIAAVENAGRARAFGPLPKGWQGDRLPVSTTLAPNN